MDPYVIKALNRSTETLLSHEQTCAVVQYGPVMCNCGALNRWMSGFVPELPVVDGFAATREA